MTDFGKYTIIMLIYPILIDINQITSICQYLLKISTIFNLYILKNLSFE